MTFFSDLPVNLAAWTTDTSILNMYMSSIMWVWSYTIAYRSSWPTSNPSVMSFQSCLGVRKKRFFIFLCTCTTVRDDHFSAGIPDKQFEVVWSLQKYCPWNPHFPPFWIPSSPLAPLLLFWSRASSGSWSMMSKDFKALLKPAEKLPLISYFSLYGGLQVGKCLSGRRTKFEISDMIWNFLQFSKKEKMSLKIR